MWQQIPENAFGATQQPWHVKVTYCAWPGGYVPLIKPKSAASPVLNPVSKALETNFSKINKISPTIKNTHLSKFCSKISFSYAEEFISLEDNFLGEMVNF